MKKTTTILALFLLTAALGAVDPEAVLERAAELHEQGETERALLLLEPMRDDHRALLLLGTIRFEEGDYEAAVEALERAVELAPERADYRLSLGAAYLRRVDEVGRLKKLFVAGNAREAFEKAVELDPKSIEARWALLSYLAEAPGMAGGSLEKAREHARALVEIDPAQGHTALATLHLKQEEWEPAEKELQLALEAGTQDPGITMNLGFLYQRMERWSDAFEAFEKVLELEPDHGMALYQVGRTGALSGERLDRAAEALRAYLEREPGEGEPTRAHAFWRLGMVYEKAGETERALTAYRKALAENPDLEEAKAGLARLAEAE